MKQPQEYFFIFICVLQIIMNGSGIKNTNKIDKPESEVPSLKPASKVLKSEFLD